MALVDDPMYATNAPIKYIGLASSNSTSIQLFYDCSSTPAHIDTQLATKYALVGHPLLLQDPVFSAPVDKRNCKYKHSHNSGGRYCHNCVSSMYSFAILLSRSVCFVSNPMHNWPNLHNTTISKHRLGLQSRCKTYSATKYEYNDFFNLADIENSQPDGYIARLAFYAQGTRNAHVLLSRTATPDLANENLYEFSEYLFYFFILLVCCCCMHCSLISFHCIAFLVYFHCLQLSVAGLIR